jgi:Tfp pilus assembly protein PilF
MRSPAAPRPGAMPTVHEHSTTKRPRTAALATALFALTALAFANGVSGAFVFDDVAAIAENDSLRGLWTALTETGASATTIGRPLLNFSLALNRAIDSGPAGYHVVNIAIHAAAALVLFELVRRTLAPRFTDGAATAAFAVAALWALHPLQTESVTYVCQRAESLAALFVLVTVWAADRGRASGRPGRWHVLAVAAAALGMATKETAVVAPVLVLLHDRTFGASSFREALRARPRLYAGLAATWLLLAALVASSAGRRGSAGFDAGVSVAEYAATQPGAIVTYLRLALWPDPLVLDRGVHVARTAGEIVPPALAVAALLGATAWAMVRRPALGSLGAAFFVTLAPTSSFVPLATQTVAEHRMYLPLAAIVAVGVLAAQAATRRAPRVRRFLVVACVAALGVVTVLRNGDYAAPRRLWEQCVAFDAGNVRAQMNLGLAMAREGDLAGGIERLDRAAAADPANAYVRLIRGNLLHEAGRSDEAVADYTAAAASAPRAARALTSRAAVLLAQGRNELALRDLDTVIARSPDYAPAHRARAAAHFARGEFDAAWTDVQSARRLGNPPSDAFVERLAAASGRER